MSDSTVDPVSAAVRELARYLRQTAPLPGFAGERTGALCNKVLESFPAPEAAMGYPTVSIHAAAPSGSRHEPKRLRTLGVSGDNDQLAETVWAVGSITVPLQLDVFANVKDQRRKVLAALRRDLRREVFAGSTTLLTLNLTEYYNEPATYRVSGGGDFGDSGFAVAREEWRSVLLLEVDVREVVVATVTQLRELITRTELLLPIDVVGVPPTSEERQVF